MSGDKTALFTRIKDVICSQGAYVETGLGWTLYDAWSPTNNAPINWVSLQNNDYFIVSSLGESGKDRLFYKILYYTGVDYFTVSGYLYWNAMTHAGVKEFRDTNGYGQIVYSSTTNNYLWLYGDLSFLYIINKYSTIKVMMHIGRVVNTMYDDTIAVCTGVITAGANGAITVDVIPSAWQVGTKLYIRDNANIEFVIIKTITVETLTITVDLVNGYTNPGLSADWCYCIGNIVADRIGTIVSRTTPIVQTILTAYSYNTTLINSIFPDKLNNQSYGMPVNLILSTQGYFGQLKNGIVVASTATDETVYTINNVNYRVHKNTSPNIVLAIKEV